MFVFRKRFRQRAKKNFRLKLFVIYFEQRHLIYILYKYTLRGRHVTYSLNIQYTCLPCKMLFTITCLNILHIIYIVYNLLCSEIDV